MAKKSAHEIRIGRIKAVVWENETSAGTRHNVQIQRLYPHSQRCNMNTPLTFSAPNHEYEQAFHELMVRKAYEQKASIKDRCRYLAFAVVDPRCPMHYYFDKSPSLTRVAYWIGEEKSPPRQVPHPVRDAVFQMSGRLGLLYTNGDSVHGQVKFRLQKPSEQEYEAIAFTRISLEAEGLKRLHLHEDRALKQRVVQRLREINIELKHIEERCKLVDEREWEERIGSDPLFASYMGNDANRSRGPATRARRTPRGT